jgi:hypothetical protein
MRTLRIKTGFHRLGIAATALCALPLLAIPPTGIPNDGSRDAFLNLCVLGTLAAYPVARALGWIVGGFVGDGKISN